MMLKNDTKLKARSAQNILVKDHTNDVVKMKGTPTLRLIDSDGNTVKTFTSNNLIVKTGRSNIIKLLGGDVSVFIKECAVGTQGTNSGDPFLPIAPIENDTALYSEVPNSRKLIDLKTYIDSDNPTQITFTTIFNSQEVNEIVSEAGLFLSDGSLFARYTFPSMYLKEDKGYSLEIAWNVQF